MMNIGVFASHGGTNLQSIIDACMNKTIDARVSVVISNNSDSLALERANKESIPCYHISSKFYPEPDDLDSSIIKILEKHSVEIIVLAGYMKKLGIIVLQKYKGRILNIHPSLLPKYGGKGMYGMRVHEAVIRSKDIVTGITIHLVDEEYDTGPIINQCEIKVNTTDTAETLLERVLEREHTFLVETLQLISENKIRLGTLGL